MLPYLLLVHYLTSASPSGNDAVIISEISIIALSQGGSLYIVTHGKDSVGYRGNVMVERAVYIVVVIALKTRVCIGKIHCVANESERVTINVNLHIFYFVLSLYSPKFCSSNKR